MQCEQLVSINDRERLRDRLKDARRHWSTYAPFLDHFRTELDDAHAVAPSEIPENRLTMNSRFEVMDLRTCNTASYTLVYPEDESLEERKLSVFSPMGMMMLGARVGDIVRWNGTTGPQVMEILRLVYQPEAAGHLDV